MLEKELQIEAAIESDSIYTTPTPSPGNDATWAEVKELEVSNKKHFYVVYFLFNMVSKSICIGHIVMILLGLSSVPELPLILSEIQKLATLIVIVHSVICVGN